ncbi:MAG: CSLREA domain-containing protein [Caldilineaceae bacterium]
MFYRPAQADAIITVTTTADAIADDAHCSLREAVIAANTDAPYGGCPAGSGVDTIHFAPALPKPATIVLTQTGANEDAAQSGDLDILDGLMISGGNGDSIQIAIDGNETDRVFHLHRGVQMSLENVIIRHGNPGSGANGGAILTELSARLTITNSQFISNSALSGGAIYGVGRVTLNNSLVEDNAGGGLTNDGGLLTLNDVIVRNNRGGYGVRNQEIGALFFNGGLVENNQSGGIYNGRSSANINHATIIGNGGSGVYSSGEILTRLTISQSQILSNIATSGAGIFSQGVGARATIMDTQISGNVATNAGGGIFNNGIMEISGSTLDHNGATSGGGIHHFGGALALTNSTVSQNSASDNGGGLYNGASATINSSTIYANTAEGSGSAIFVDESELIVGATIVARPGMGANCANSNGFINSAGYNLESSSSCGLGATGDQANADPKLTALGR